jgi:hypothetical protein
MTGNVALAGRRTTYGLGEKLGQKSTVRNRAECLVELLCAYRDIADFDDIHQAAERLDSVQAWIRREAREAAADPIFDDEPVSEFRGAHASV